MNLQYAKWSKRLYKLTSHLKRDRLTHVVGAHHAWKGGCIPKCTDTEAPRGHCVCDGHGLWFSMAQEHPTSNEAEDVPKDLGS